MNQKLRFLRPVGLLLLALMAAGCTNGYLVDASDPQERGEGGLAFVLLVLVVVTFVFIMFFADRVRARRMEDKNDEKVDQ